MQNCRLVSKTMPLLLSHDIQQVSFVFRVTLMGSTLISSMRLHKMEYRLVLLILMAVLEMLKVFYIKSDEGKMLSATIIVCNPKTLLTCLGLCCFFFSGNHVFQLFFYFFALSLGRLLALRCPGPGFCLVRAHFTPARMGTVLPGATRQYPCAHERKLE